MDYRKLTKELMRDVFELERKLFMKTDSFRLVELKCNKKCLNPDERKQLYCDIHYVFTKFIKTLEKFCPTLTEEDIMFCCLKKIGLENMIAGHCIGGISRQCINQRRYRIKKKMNEANCDYLFDMIFLSDN